MGALDHIGFNDLFSQLIFDVLLNSPFKRSCPKLFIPAFINQIIFCLWTNRDLISHLDDPVNQMRQLDVDNLMNFISLQRFKNNNIINSI